MVGLSITAGVLLAIAAWMLLGPPNDRWPLLPRLPRLRKKQQPKKPLAKLSALDCLAVLFVASLLVLMRAFLEVKLALLAVFLFAFIWSIKRLDGVVHGRLMWFYVSLAIIGSSWAVIGLLDPANRLQGVTDSVRLYAIWSVVFLVLYSLLRAGPSLRILHNAIVAAGILIPLVNFVQVYDLFTGANFIPESIARELFLQDLDSGGFVEFSGANIAAMFVIAPYLLALQFRRDAGWANSKLAKVSLVLSLVLVLLSGRRALVIVVAFTPLAILALASIVKTRAQIRGRRLLYASTLAVIIGLGSLWIVPADYIEDMELGPDVSKSLDLKAAFSADDERSIQKPYLVKAFMESPLVGTGFGAYSGYTRSEEKPWMYELTYHQMLMNLGLVGVTLVGGIFLLYFLEVVRLLRAFREGSAVPFALLLAFCGLIVGAYSNPYLGGFDSLFFAGLLPLLATFQRGFNLQTQCISECRLPQKQLPPPRC